MDRRVWGALVIAISLMLAITVPAALGRRLGGQALREPIPPAPEVGDCLLSAVDPDGSALKYVSVSIGAARMGTCSARSASVGAGNFGEIVSTTPDQRFFPRSFPNQIPTPERRECQAAAHEYVGWPRGPWLPAITRTLILVGPDVAQYLSGHRWIACAMLPVEGYSGSIRFHQAGSAADAFGRCEVGGASDPEPVACTRPHDVEIIGSAAIDGIDDASVNASCRELLTVVTGMTDPTAGGQLHVITMAGLVHRDYHSESTSFAATCAIQVNGNRLLSSSMLGLGTGPLPWS